jgi:hypothetical protein
MRRPMQLFSWAIATVILLIFSRSVLSQEVEEDGLDDAWYVTEVGEAAPMVGSATCNPNGTYCTGLFDELIDYLVYWAGTPGGPGVEGKVQILLQEVPRAAAGSVCALENGNFVLVPADEPSRVMLLNQITLARALGTRFRIDFRTGPSGLCEIRRLFVPY